jgi:hypothetical protein
VNYGIGRVDDRGRDIPCNVKYVHASSCSGSSRHVAPQERTVRASRDGIKRTEPGCRSAVAEIQRQRLKDARPQAELYKSRRACLPRCNSCAGRLVESFAYKLELFPSNVARPLHECAITFFGSAYKLSWSAPVWQALSRFSMASQSPCVVPQQGMSPHKPITRGRILLSRVCAARFVKCGSAITLFSAILNPGNQKNN